jgi:hypothetical protein
MLDVFIQISILVMLDVFYQIIVLVLNDFKINFLLENIFGAFARGSSPEVLLHWHRGKGFGLV